MNTKSCLQTSTITLFIILLAGFVADKTGLFGETVEEGFLARKNTSQLKVNSNYLKQNSVVLYRTDELLSSSKSVMIASPTDYFYIDSPANNK